MLSSLSRFSLLVFLRKVVGMASSVPLMEQSLSERAFPLYSGQSPLSVDPPFSDKVSWSLHDLFLIGLDLYLIIQCIRMLLARQLRRR
jgi:hypothetical protein